MATFVEIQTDSFAGNLELAAMSKRDFSGVRRPYRGIEIKEDTYGLIKVIKNDGNEIPLTDAGGVRPGQSGGDTGAASDTAPKTKRQGRAHTYNYSNFIIQRIEESRQEKQQIIETFGDTYIFFYGERPRILQVSGLLMNTRDFNWRTEFWWNYENVLRGTKLVEQNARLYLFWDDVVVEGYMLSANAQDNSESPYHIPFTFQLFVTNHTYLSAIGDDAYPINHAVALQPLLTQKNNIGEAISTLKKKGVAAKTKEEDAKTVERAANLISLETQLGLKAPSPNATVQAFGAGKNLLANALAIAVNASNLTFLSIVNHIFRNRVMRFPKGLAGGDQYTGEPQYANQPNMFRASPQRTAPLRSKIRDNRDEYVGGSYAAVVQDEDAIRQAKLEQEFKDPFTLEAQALIDLAQMGVVPIQHPGGSPFANPHAMAVVGTIAAYNIARFALPKFGL